MVGAYQTKRKERQVGDEIGNHKTERARGEVAIRRIC
jgi:hypothetical protein